jgi:cytosine/adenosine deaminase-related metal-dependent hydrolase
MLQALRMATLNGAIALGGSHDFGSLQVSLRLMAALSWAPPISC